MDSECPDLKAFADNDRHDVAPYGCKIYGRRDSELAIPAAMPMRT
jgi:hypothetical protein